jgi:hypothetical protein
MGKIALFAAAVAVFCYNWYRRMALHQNIRPGYVGWLDFQSINHHHPGRRLHLFRTMTMTRSCPVEF